MDAARIIMTHIARIVNAIAFVCRVAQIKKEAFARRSTDYIIAIVIVEVVAQGSRQ